MANKYSDLNSETPYKYLNCGGFIGFAKDIKELLEDNDFDLDNFPEAINIYGPNAILKIQIKLH